MSDANRPLVLGVGELLWDCFPDGRRPGGAPANVAFHANQLDLRGVIVSRVGTDESGEALRRHLQELGLDISAIQVDERYPTGTVTVDMTRPDQPQYTIHDQVAWDYLAFEAGLAGLAMQASAVCFGTLAQRHDGTRATVQRVLAAAGGDCLRVFDVNLRQKWYRREVIEASLRSAQVVKLNDAEVEMIAPLLDLPRVAEDFASVLRELYAVKLVCVTRGERGCVLYAKDERVEQAGVPVEVVDAVGAGDAFTAGLIAGLLHRWPLERVARVANQIGALVASRPGAMPQLGGEFAEILNESPGQAT